MYVVENDSSIYINELCILNYIQQLIIKDKFLERERERYLESFLEREYKCVFIYFFYS